MANILFEYIYRDASNWKKHGGAVFTNESGIPLADIEARIRTTLCDGEWFKAEMVALETCFFNPPEEQTEDDHPWHEFERVSETDRPPSDPAYSARRDIAEFLRAMEIGKARSWEEEKKVCCMSTSFSLARSWRTATICTGRIVRVLHSRQGNLHRRIYSAIAIWSPTPTAAPAIRSLYRAAAYAAIGQPTEPMMAKCRFAWCATRTASC